MHAVVPIETLDKTDPIVRAIIAWMEANGGGEFVWNSEARMRFAIEGPGYHLFCAAGRFVLSDAMKGRKTQSFDDLTVVPKVVLALMADDPQMTADFLAYWQNYGEGKTAAAVRDGRHRRLSFKQRVGFSAPVRATALRAFNHIRRHREGGFHGMSMDDLIRVIEELPR